MRGIEEMTAGLVKTYSAISEDKAKLFTPQREAIGTCPRCGAAVYEGKKKDVYKRQDVRLSGKMATRLYPSFVGISFFSLSARDEKPVFTNSAVGKMACVTVKQNWASFGK